MSKQDRGTTWKKNRKTNYLEPKKCAYYIFCEGTKTEPLYFSGFKKLIESNPIYRNMVTIEIEPCQAETLRVLESAKKCVYKNKVKNAQIWCVYDKDDFPAKDFNEVLFQCETLNKANTNIQYQVAWSNECFEFWFILHFAFYTSDTHRSEYAKFLNNKFLELKIGKYDKTSEHLFSILLEKGNPKSAIKYAKKIIENNKEKVPSDIKPGTTVYHLVEELAKYLPKDISVKFI